MAPRRLPTLSSLRAFEAAARHGSFKLAAHELNVTPTSISHQVKSLEEQLKLRLFDRFNRRVELTDAGEQYAQSLTDAFDAIQAATSSVAGMAGDQTVRQRLVIACNPGFVDCWLRARLADFQMAYPGIWPEIISSDETREQLAKGADLALHYGLPLDGLTCDLLTRTTVFPVCAPTLLTGSHALKAPGDLKHQTLLHEKDTRYWAQWLRQAGIAADIDWHAGPVFHTSVLVVDTAVAGHGVGLADELIAGDHLAAGRLVKPFDLTMETKHASYFVTPATSDALPEGVEAFRGWVTGQIEQFRPLMDEIGRQQAYIRTT